MNALTKALAAALVVSSPILLAQTPKPTRPPAKPASSGGVTVSSGQAEPPPGARPAEIQDLRIHPQLSTDAYEFERLGLTAYRQNELEHARQFFEQSWKVGELPSAQYNLACLDAVAGKTDSAFQRLEKAIAAGFDDGLSLEKDPDLKTLRGSARFAKVQEAAKRNRAEGDAAVVKEGIFLPPAKPPVAILMVLQDRSSDPFTASGPFTNEGQGRSFFLAVPRGPSRSGGKRFGWEDPARSLAAVDAALAAARQKTANARIPVFLVGLGRGGTLALTVASLRPGVFAGVASIGGPFDPMSVPGGPKGLRGTRLFLGIPSDGPQAQLAAFRHGRDSLKLAGFSTTYAEWPGTGTTLPNDAPKAVKQALDALAGVGAAAPKAVSR